MAETRAEEYLDARRHPAAVPLAGEMVVVGQEAVDLFDEDSGRWLTLPHPMAQPRYDTQVVSLPASALQAS